MIQQRCLALRKEGCSIGQIARVLNVSKSTVHWHVRGVCLTAIQRARLRSQKREVMAKVNARRRGRPLNPTPFSKPVWSAPLVHLIAHLSFDGRVDRHGCFYYSRHHSQTLHVRRLLERLLDVAPKVRQRPNGIWVMNYYNVAVAAWLSQKEHELLHVVGKRPRWQQPWLQALFDDEGHVHFSRSIRRVRASQDDPMVLRRTQRFLETFGIASRLDPAAKAVEITGRNNLTAFRNRINFSPGLRINAARKNGLWRYPLEKRELLDIALDSYESSAL